jgi:hypothetical protein
MDGKTDICVFCHFARMRKDICGIYCIGGCCKNPDGTCDRFLDYQEHRKSLRKRRKGEKV